MATITKLPKEAAARTTDRSGALDPDPLVGYVMKDDRIYRGDVVTIMNPTLGSRHSMSKNAWRQFWDMFHSKRTTATQYRQVGDYNWWLDVHFGTIHTRGRKPVEANMRLTR